MRVLVVDDDAPIRLVLAELLETEGYAVREAANGADALRAFEIEHPDAIVLDLMLPDMDGSQVAETCYRETTGLPVPILLMSASPHLWRVADQLRRFGVRGFVSKPFDLDVVVRVLQQMTAPVAAVQLAS